MDRQLKYADLHLHLTLKPFLNTTNNNYSSIWKYSRTSYIARSGKARTSMDNLIQGGVKIIFPALGYIEQGWQMIDTPRFKIPAIFRNVGDLMIFLMNVNFAQIDDFFSLLIREMDYLLQQARPPMDVSQDLRQYEIVFPHSLSEYEAALNDKNKIISLPSIEGAHALISGTVSYEKFNVDTDRVVDNVKKIKRHKARPVFMTFSHHFFNGLAGHAHSLYKFTRILDQHFGLGNPISPAGWRVIRCLLGLEQGCDNWPVLIDTKHFSLAARREYFDFIAKEMNYSIPVINSHAAYSGSLTIENVIYPNPPFSYNQTNISAEEVYHIWRSKGLIGINFDQDILWNGPGIKDISKIVENIVSMVQGAIQFAQVSKLPLPDETIWDVFCLGTDFDGFIDPLDSYPSPLFFPRLEQDMLQALDQNNQLRMLDISIPSQQIVERFMHGNVESFVRRYFSNL